MISVAFLCIIYFLSFLFQPQVFAQDEREAELVLRAKTKAYPGGVDEVDLKVQPVLPKPTRKMAPVIEKIEESPLEEQNNEQ